MLYTLINNILETDVIEINIKTKDFKFLMFDKKNKIQLTNKQ